MPRAAGASRAATEARGSPRLRGALLGGGDRVLGGHLRDVFYEPSKTQPFSSTVVLKLPSDVLNLPFEGGMNGFFSVELFLEEKQKSAARLPVLSGRLPS